MSAAHQFIAGAVVMVAILAVGAARFPLFQRDLRRPISCGVSVLGLLTIVLSIHVLVTGLRLRAAALDTAQEAMAAQWNGLILGAIMLLLVSALAFFFALGAFIWSLLPTNGPPPKPLRRRAFGAFEPGPHTAKRLNER